MTDCELNRWLQHDPTRRRLFYLDQAAAILCKLQGKDPDALIWAATRSVASAGRGDRIGSTVPQRRLLIMQAMQHGTADERRTHDMLFALAKRLAEKDTENA